jgi:hypothetical protein
MERGKRKKPNLLKSVSKRGKNSLQGELKYGRAHAPPEGD